MASHCTYVDREIAGETDTYILYIYHFLSTIKSEELSELHFAIVVLYLLFKYYRERLSSLMHSFRICFFLSLMKYIEKSATYIYLRINNNRQQKSVLLIVYNSQRQT